MDMCIYCSVFNGGNVMVLYDVKLVLNMDGYVLLIYNSDDVYGDVKFYIIGFILFVVFIVILFILVMNGDLFKVIMIWSVVILGLV